VKHMMNVAPCVCAYVCVHGKTHTRSLSLSHTHTHTSDPSNGAAATVALPEPAGVSEAWSILASASSLCGASERKIDRP